MTAQGQSSNQHGAVGAPLEQLEPSWCPALWGAGCVGASAV